MRSAEAVRPVAVSAISQCGSVKAETIADPRFGLVGQFLPAVAYIDAKALEAEQHGRCILVE
jgi:hypothetical protein